MAIQTTNPLNNKILKTFDEMTPAAVDQAIEKATHTFEQWKKTDYKERAALLYKVAGLLRAKKKDLAYLITLDKAQSNWRTTRHTTLEFPVLSGRSFCSTQYYDWQSCIDKTRF